jgi:prephenate dehydrogenase
MWRITGADVSTMSVEQHDAVLAATSHLPHLLAFALVDALAGEPEQRSIFRYAAGGFRDFTRIAGSDPTMWRDIALANGPALVAALDRVTAHVATLRAAIEQGDGEELMASFTRARQAREEFGEELRLRSRGSGTSE